MTSTWATPTPRLKRHPIRGALYGLVLGLGVALFLIGQKIAAFGTMPPILAIVGGVVVGVLWALFAPPKAVTGPVPAGTTPTQPAYATDTSWGTEATTDAAPPVYDSGWGDPAAADAEWAAEPPPSTPPPPPPPPR